MDPVDRSFLHLLEIEPRSLGCPALSLVAIPTDQSQLHWRMNEEVMKKKKKLHGLKSASELYRPSDRRLSAK
jgi:hypothetical protein